MDSGTHLPVTLINSTSLLKHQRGTIQWVDRLLNLKSTPNDMNESHRLRKGCILALSMGLGKTLIALYTIMLLRKSRVNSTHMYVTTKTLIGTVLFEIRKFFGTTMCVLVMNSDELKNKDVMYDYTKYDVVLTTYDTLNVAFNRDPTNQLFQHLWETVFLDESQILYTKGSITFRNVMALYKRHGFCLLSANLFDVFDVGLFNCIEFTNLLRCIPTKMQKPDLIKAESVCNGLFLLRSSDINLALPPKQLQYHTLKFTENDVIRIGSTLVAHLRELCASYTQLTETTKRLKTYNQMVQYLALIRRYLILPSILNPDSTHPVHPAIRGELQSLVPYRVREGLTHSHSSKFKFVAKLLTHVWINDKTSTDRFVVYSSFPAVLKELKSYLTARGTSKVSLIYGRTSTKQRDTIVSALSSSSVEESNAKVLLIPYALGTVGLNLVGVNHCIHLDPCYNKFMFDQSVGRIHRMGQVKPVHVWVPIMDASVEIGLVKMLDNDACNANTLKMGLKIPASTILNLMNNTV